MSAFYVYGVYHYGRDPGYDIGTVDAPFVGCAHNEHETKYITVVVKERRGRRFVAFDETWLDDRP